jgi:hypothetical protein
MHTHRFPLCSVALLAALHLCACANSQGGGEADMGSPDLPGADMTRYPYGDCDPLQQACGTGQKCTFISTGSRSGAVATRCIAATGQGNAGDACTREPPDAFGQDDCGPGLLCTNLGEPPTLRCRRYCAGAGNCTSGTACVNFLSSNLLSQPLGLCAPTCTLFGNDCPTGHDCSGIAFEVPSTPPINRAPVCRPTGTAQAGDACQNALCAPGHICNPTGGSNPTCAVLCDAQHPCATGTCTPLPGLPNDGGYCAP